MDILQELIASLGKEELRHYKLVSNRTQNAEERRDHALLDAIRSQNDRFSEENFSKEHYGSAGANAYYRLKNRLLHDLLAIQWLHHLKTGPAQQALTWYGLARVFRRSNRRKVAQYLLLRAEKLALKAEEYELLDLIYAEMIRSAHERSQSVDPESIIEQRNDNSRRIEMFRDLDETLARAHFIVQISQNYDRAKAEEGAVLLRRLIAQVESIPQADRTRRTRFQLFHAISRLLLQTRDYAALESFTEKHYHEFESAGWFDKNTHDDRLRMLVFLVNAAFKNGSFDRSLDWAQLLEKNLESFNRLLYDRYWVFYANALVINYAQLDPDRALKLLEDMKEHPLLRSMPFYEVFFFTNRALLWYRKGNRHRALQELHRFSTHERFSELAGGLRLRMALAELMIRFEDEDLETCSLRQQQFRKDFAELLASIGKETAFFQIMSDLIRRPNRQTAGIRRRIIDFCISYREDNDDELIPYVEWLYKRLSWLKEEIEAE